MARKYKAAIIGLGGFSRMHAIAFSMVPRTDLVAACDINPDKFDWWANRVSEFISTDGLGFHDDPEKMLHEVRPDIVGITTKHDQHAPLTILCAKAGVRGVICEKPIAMNLGEADEMIRACRKSGTKLAIGHQRRFNLDWNAALKLVRKGTIGQVLLAISRWPDGDYSKYRYEIFGGGPLMWLSVHSIDLLRYFLGDIKWATAQVDLAAPEINTETRACALLAFKEGPQALVECGPGIGPEASLGHSITFYGQKGTIQVADGYGVRYKTTSRPKWREVKLPPQAKPWQTGARYACRDQVRDMIHAIEKDAEPRCSGKEGRAALEAVMAIYESERTGGLVRLPLKKKTSPLLEMTRAGGYGQVTWQPHA